MKTPFKVLVILLSVFLMITGLAVGQVPQLINYQGVLIDPSTGQPVDDDTYEMVFSIYDVATGGSAIWTEIQSVTTKDGLYSVLLGSTTPLSPTILTGPEKYLGIKVGSDPEMAPRKRIVSVAYSILSEDAHKLEGKEASDFVQTGQANSISTDMLQNDAVTTAKILPNVVSSLDGVSNDGGDIDLVAGSNVSITPDDVHNQITISTSGDAGWSLTGNSGTTPGTNFVGTTDNQALELKVNSVRALRLEPHTGCPNVIIGNSNNKITSGVYGSTISGGGSSSLPNNVSDNYCTVGGGTNNRAGNDDGDPSNARYATVSGGVSNTASGEYSSIGGGLYNITSSIYASICGGYQNEVSGSQATIAGGSSNIASGNTNF